MNENKEALLRITNQFHSKGGMAYDLKCRGARLSLHITQRTRADDAGEWHIEARGPAEQGGSAVVVGEWGATRRTALGAVARAWREAAVAQQRPDVFDWDAIAAALDTVRAL
jgi:hypothetical protein